MSIKQFPEDLHTLEIQTAETLLGGYSLQTDQGGYLDYIKSRFYFHGNVSPNANLRLSVYSDIGQTDLVSQSPFYKVSEIEDYEGSWLGDLSFDMSPKISLLPDILGNMVYYVTVEVDNYTYTPTENINIVFGYPFNPYTGQDNKLVGRVEFFVLR